LKQAGDFLSGIEDKLHAAVTGEEGGNTEG
jgi:hypothetical protein